VTGYFSDAAMAFVFQTIATRSNSCHS